MKITDIRGTVLASKYDRQIHFAHMDLSERKIILLEVMTDEGLVGYGDIDGPPAGSLACLRVIEESFRPLLVGKNPLEIGARHQEMFAILNTLGRYKSLESYVLGAIDIALWDILGKATGQPIRNLLGKRRDTLLCYASLGRLMEEEVRAQVEQYAKAGFGGVKIRIGFPDARDEKIIEAARSVLSKDAPTKLMADANSGWQRANAIPRGRELDKYGLFWLEEPLQPYDIPGYAELNASISTPVALGEHEIFNRYDARDLIVAKAARILQPDLRQGISECVHIASVASAWEIPCIPHFFGPAVRFAAMAQFLGSIDNYVMCEYPVAHDPIRFELTDPPLIAQNGRLAIPDGPGLGIEIRRDTVEKYSLSDI